MQDFQRATTTRAIETLRAAAVALEPSILTWANGIIDNQDWELNSFDAMRSALNTGFNEGGGTTWAEGLFGQVRMEGCVAPVLGACCSRRFAAETAECH